MGTDDLGAAGLPLVDAVDIIRLVGPRSFARAQEYARTGKVHAVAWDPETRTVSSSVAGSGGATYRTEVDLVPGRGEFWRPSHSECTCPLGGDCKHAAAALLRTNADALLERTPVDPVAGGSGTTWGSPSDRQVPDWRASLDALAGSDRPTSVRTAAMGLLFELRDLTVGRGYAPVRRLGVRPVVRSESGNWVRSGLTWGTLPYSMNRLAIDPDQHAWFGQFAALHKSARTAYVPGEGDWLFLDDFASPLLWPLLTEAGRIGVALVTGMRATDVTLGTSARIALDARRDGPDRPLVIGARATIDGAPTDPASTGVVGTHGVYTWVLRPEFQLTLAPTDVPVPDDQRRLLLGRDAIVVPDADVDEFLRDVAPQLRSRVDVVSSDGSITFPVLRPPELVLVVTFGTGTTASLAWHWDDNGRERPVDALGPLPDLDPAPSSGAPWFVDRTIDGLAAAEFVTTALPGLSDRDDLRVEIRGEQPPYRELTAPPELTITTVETEQRDWFDLGVLVTVEGHTVPLTPLLTALAKRQRKLLLIDKTYLSLGHPAFDELKRLIDEAMSLDEWDTGAPRISRYQASLWSEFDQIAAVTHQAETWRRTVGGLLELQDAPATRQVPVPDGVHATLRPYQHDGFTWLAFLYEHALGGVLADDMGLGKTLQTLALIEHVRAGERADADAARLPFLVVAPTSVVSNWVAEAARFTPGLDVRAVTATSSKARARFRDALASADVVVTSYALLRLDAAAYQRQEWAGVILDEAQFVKNPASQAHRVATGIRAPFRLAITGTPLENGLMDLWALFHVVAPGLLSTSVRFGDDYVKPLAAGDRPDLLDRLRRRIRPLMLRRTKELVAADLPDKQEQVLRVDLAPAHRALYDAVLQRERLKLLDLIDDLDRNRMVVFRSLTLLRMLSIDAALIDDDYHDVPSAKLDQLLDELDDVVAEGHRALVFSQFTSFLGRVAARLDERGITHEYLDGSTRRRGEVIERFKSGTAPAFLISLKAGGFGLNLTEADYVFILDPWWNPASEAQAVDRTHRIGQTENVMVYRLIANDTIEEKVLALKDRKAALFDAVMDDDAVFSSALTADDIRALLD